MNVVANNIPGMFTSRQLGITNRSKVKSMEKLSSGYKINRAADDAAGLTISENMRRMIRGLTQASLNTEDGVSLCQVADGYLNEVHDMLHRLTELSVKGSNGTLTDDDRQAIDEEVSQLKKEMRRIFNVANFNEIPLFHVPYTPEVSAPDDMEVFHVGNGQVGGLEFNNVRYNISELQALGIPIDNNGIATDDLEFGDGIFELWDGEEVDLSIKKGQSIDQALRNYKWEAKDDGIYINNKLTAEWGEVRYGQDEDWSKRKLLSETDMLSTGTFASGTYSFSHHGMKIEFEIDEEANMEELKNGINGDEATKPATWDVSASGTKGVQSADISNGYNKLDVTEANKWFIDYNYSVVADSNGIAIRRENPNDATDFAVSDYVSWSSFKDSSLKNITDENENEVTTNNGYPIGNWGTGNDGNDSSTITFDGNATYHFKTPDSFNVPIEFDFKLAESASFDEVVSALNGAQINTLAVSAPGTLSRGNTPSLYGEIRVGSVTTLANDFDLQRAYGRDFDANPGSAASELTATITVKRSTIDGQPSADDSPDTDDGRYSGNTHSVTRSTTPDDQKLESSVITNTSSTHYSVMPERTDGGVVWHYFEDKSFWKQDTFTNTYNSTDTWTQRVAYTFEGELNRQEMNSVQRNQIESYSRTIVQKQEEVVSYQETFAKARTYDELPDEVRAVIEANPDIFKDPDTTGQIEVTIDGKTAWVDKGRSYTDMSQMDGHIGNVTSVKGNFVTEESGIGDATLDSIRPATSGGNNNISFTSSKGTAFSFNYSETTAQAINLAGKSDAQTIGTITFTPGKKATREFNPIENSNTINQATFKSKLNVPKKNLNIQSSADKDHYITMEWSPLNLTILGIYGANTKTQESSREAIGMVQDALNVISDTRSLFGAYQNRFEHTIRNLDNVVENTQAAESRIRDTDMASEMVKLAKDNILEQAGTAMLVQSNQSKNWIINLLNG